MNKQALHADDRLRERTSLPPEVLGRLRASLRATQLPRGTHHTRLGTEGYAVLKDTGKHHVVATVLSRNMVPPGKDVTARMGIKKEAGADAGQDHHRSLKSVRSLKRKLTPGDILLTAPRGKPKGLIWKLYRPISQKIQGTDYGHSALYIGDGKVVDARIGKGTKERTLSSVARQNRILALSPKVSERERKEAVEFAKDSLHSPYSTVGILRAAFPFRGKRGHLPSKDELRQKALDSGICSGLVAYAYKRLKFSDSSRDLTRPGEILRSGKLEVVGRLGRRGEEFPR